MGPILVLANPIAGRGQANLIAQAIAAYLSCRTRRINLVDRLQQPLDPQHLDAQACIVVGGDGTVRLAVQRLLEAKALGLNQPSSTRPAQLDPTRPAIPPLLLVPAGTANLMARHLGIAWNQNHLPEQVASSIQIGRTRDIDAALAESRVFLLMAGVGFDAMVVHELDRMRQGPISIGSYVRPLIRALRGYRYPAMTVRVDGRTVTQHLRGLSFVGNVPEYGTGFPILPLAKADDRLLDVCVLPCASAAELVRLFLLAGAGEHVGAEGVVYVKGRSVCIDSDEPIPVQIDGEPASFTPVRIDLLPHRIPFIVPVDDG